MAKTKASIVLIVSAVFAAFPALIVGLALADRMKLGFHEGFLVGLLSAFVVSIAMLGWGLLLLLLERVAPLSLVVRLHDRIAPIVACAVLLAVLVASAAAIYYATR